MATPKKMTPSMIRRKQQSTLAKKGNPKGPTPFPGSPPVGKPAGSRGAAIRARRGTPPVDNRKPTIGLPVIKKKKSKGLVPLPNPNIKSPALGSNNGTIGTPRLMPTKRSTGKRVSAGGMPPPTKKIPDFRTAGVTGKRGRAALMRKRTR